MVTSLEPTQTSQMNQETAMNFRLEGHDVSPGGKLRMKAQHGGTCQKDTPLHHQFPNVAHDTGAEKCLECVPTRSMHQERRRFLCGSRGLLKKKTTCSVYLTDYNSSLGTTKGSCLHP